MRNKCNPPYTNVSEDMANCMIRNCKTECNVR
jgi:hypothetical protein